MGKLFCFAILLLVSQNSFGYDINELRELALKHIEKNMETIRATINQTLHEIPYRVKNLQEIVIHETSAGEVVTEGAKADVHKAATTGNMAGILLNSYPLVKECIQNAEQRAISDIDFYHTDRFIKPLNDFKAEAEKIQDDNVRKWTDEYNNAVIKFSEQYEAIVRDIIKSNDEAEIGWLVREFDLLCHDFYTVINNVYAYLSQTQYELLLFLDKLVDSLREYSRIIFDAAQLSIRECFKTYKGLQPINFNLTIPAPIKNNRSFLNLLKNRPILK